MQATLLGSRRLPEGVGGSAGNKGDGIFVCFATAPRDERKFNEPDSFAPKRKPERSCRLRQGRSYWRRFALAQVGNADVFRAGLQHAADVIHLPCARATSRYPELQAARKAADTGLQFGGCLKPGSATRKCGPINAKEWRMERTAADLDEAAPVSSALQESGAAGASAELTGLEIAPIGAGAMADTCRMLLTWSREGAGPRSLVDKKPSTNAAAAATAASIGAYEREAKFYLELAPPDQSSDAAPVGRGARWRRPEHSAARGPDRGLQARRSVR